MAKETGLPIAEGLDAANELPHTISFAVMYRVRIDSFNELPKDKRPPRDLWDKPYRLSKFLVNVWKSDKDPTKETEFIDLDDEEPE